jgi:hypothetical protein
MRSVNNIKIKGCIKKKREERDTLSPIVGVATAISFFSKAIEELPPDHPQG